MFNDIIIIVKKSHKLKNGLQTSEKKEEYEGVDHCEKSHINVCTLDLTQAVQLGISLPIKTKTNSQLLRIVLPDLDGKRGERDYIFDTSDMSVTELERWKDSLSVDGVTESVYAYTNKPQMQALCSYNGKY